MTTIEQLSEADIAAPEFLSLLREAVGVDDEALQRTIATELPALTTVGIRERGVVVAFAAFDLSRPTQIVLEYIAVDQSVRSTGYGRALIEFIHDQDRAKELLAETDDDAVEFYRRLGFSISKAPTDPRWPDRQRYQCRRVPLSGHSPRE